MIYDISMRKMASANPERIGIIQPRVARNELPWVRFFKFPTLKELNPIRLISETILIQPLQGWADSDCPQGRRCYANPGLYDCNPVGVAEGSHFHLWLISIWKRGIILAFLLLLPGCGPGNQVKPLEKTDLGGYFESIQFHHDKLYLKLHDSGAHYTSRTGAVTEYGQIFALPLTASMELIAKHGGLKIVPMATPSDLIFEAESSFDGGDSGGPSTKKYYLIQLIPAGDNDQDVQILEETSKAVSTK